MPRKTGDNALGDFLRVRRGQLDPEDLGFPMERRRTPGLRREEVARLANLSPAWYTWLEQGRGGVPSADMLDRLAIGLRLTVAEREHLYVLAQNRPPAVEATEPGPIDVDLQRVLDAFDRGPALIRTSAWDVLAGNSIAQTLWPGDGNGFRPNVLKSLFTEVPGEGDPGRDHWLALVRVAVAQFRAEAFQAGWGPRAQAVVSELRKDSQDFEWLWNQQEVGLDVEATKTLDLPHRGTVTFHATKFSIDGRPGLKLVLLLPLEVDRPQA